MGIAGDLASYLAAHPPKVSPTFRPSHFQLSSSREKRMNILLNMFRSFALIGFTESGSKAQKPPVQRYCDGLMALLFWVKRFCLPKFFRACWKRAQKEQRCPPTMKLAKNSDLRLALS